MLASQSGPGRITRIWSANPSGVLTVELDGDAWYRGPFADLFATPRDGVDPRLLGAGVGGGHLSQVPIAFQRELRVLVEGPLLDELYYQIEVERRAEHGTGICREDAAALLDEGNSVQHHATGARVTIDGPGEVVELRARFATGVPPLEQARQLFVEIMLDDEPRPSIAAPLGDLFGVAWNGASIDTLPLYPRGDDLVLRLPMPFARRFVLRTTPLAETAPAVSFVCGWRELPDVGDRLPLRASFTRAHTRRGEPFSPAVIVGGRGHLVGFVAALAGGSGQGLGFLEGDLSLRIDGENPPRYRGTGTEDDFDGAWYFRGGAFRSSFDAVAELDLDRSRLMAARFLVPDPFAFAESLEFALEHGGNDDAPGSDYALTLFWYGGAPPPADQGLLQARANLVEQCAPCPVEWARGNAPPERDLARLRGRPAVIAGIDRDGRVLEDPIVVMALCDDDLERRTPDAPRLRVAPWLPSLRRFAFAGPFAVTTSMEGVREVFAPERESPFSGWRAPRAPVGWDGYVDLYGEADPRDGVVMYAQCRFDVTRDAAATLVLGSDDAVAVFLDGERVFEHATQRGSARDSDRVPLALTRGTHRLMLKIENYRGGFGFHARIEGVEIDELDALDSSRR